MPVAAGAAREAHREGVAAFAAGRPEEAAGHLRRALALIDGAGAPDRDSAVLRVRVLISLALPAFEEDGLPGARPLLDRAESEARRLDDGAELLGLCHSQRAHVLGRSGRMSEALAELEAAGDHLKAMAPRDRWGVLINRGVSHSMCGDLDEAATDLAEAADLAARTGLADEQRMAEHNLGWVRFLRGDLPAALAAMVTAGETDEEGPAPAVALLDHGRVLLEAGLLADAVRMLERARDLCRRHGTGHVELETTVELARAHEARGAPERSAQLVREAAASSDVRGASGWAAWCAVLAAHHDLAQDPQRALVTTEATAATTDDPSLARRAHLVAAEAAIGAGRSDRAHRHLVAARRLAGSGPRPSLSSRLEQARVEAAAARAAGDDAKARKLLARAADDLASSAASVTTLDLRTARAVHAAQLAAADLALARDSGPEAVFEAAERWRARGSRLPAARPHPSRHVADLLAEVRRTAEQQRLGAEPEERARLARLERTAAAAVRAGSAGATDPAVELGTPGPDRLRDAVRDEEADLLTLVEQDGDLWAVGLVGGEIRAHRLGARRALDELARRVRVDLAVAGSQAPGPLAEAVNASLEAGVAVLRDRVLGGFGASAERLVVVPTAALADLPWTLVAGGRPVTVASSATAWWHARERARARSDRADRSVELAVVTGPRLAQAEAEATAVRSAWGAGADLHEVGDGVALRSALGSADVVHIGAHGRHHPENPMFSSVALTDGPTFLYDLESDGVGAGHVVLAACDTGRVEVRPGEEPLGLAVGMLALGAGCVLAAAAPVPDALVAEVMPAYHGGLAHGAPADVALADALRGRPAAAGAFVVTGAAWAR